MLDLELLHHFCTSTAYTFHGDATLKTLWRISVPQVGFVNDFVMRGILALAARHLANSKPEQKDFYMAYAIEQHQAGLRKASAMLPTVNAQNVTALYIFTAMACMFSLAGPRRSTDSLIMSDGSIAEWLVLLRGTRTIIEPWQDARHNGILGPMFIHGSRRHKVSTCSGRLFV
jgi:hypothetical protein